MTDGHKPKLLIVEDDRPLARIMGRSLASRADVRLAHSYATAQRALRERDDWAFFLFDVILSANTQENGVRLLEEAREQFPDTPAILITGHMAPSHTHAAVRLQAIFLSKPVRREELVTAYDEARARFGDRFASTALDAAAAFLLSDREREVLEQRLRGHLRLEVAARLGITVRTYDTFAQRIKDKMGKPISELGLEQVSEMLAERRSEQ